MSDVVYKAALERREGMQFYCPNGHPQHYVSGESECTTLRRERDRLKQEQARLQDAIRHERERAEHERNRANGYKGAATRMKNRARAGVCPCCNRHFVNLERHMTAKHSEEELTALLGDAAQ